MTSTSEPWSVIRWLDDDQVIVFDQRGRQMPSLQGRYSEVRDRVLAAAIDRTRFEVGRVRDYLRPVPREEW